MGILTILALGLVLAVLEWSMFRDARLDNRQRIKVRLDNDQQARLRLKNISKSHRPH